mgnify:CR=1 FL=1|tara:strand:+ start:906 stop:2114 length:1209 start_codon:yes stop_codon:yes gene_type:complete
MANFDTQIQALAGSATQTEMDDWAADGVKEIINILPPKLKQKCSTYSLLNADNGTTLDLDGIGDILYVTRENANSGYYIGCREISPLLADSANDSSSLNYATATDPVYWTESNSSDIATLFIKPTPTNNQPAKAYHITYPTVNVSDVSTIANFPDEAEYLVVLYAAIKVLQNKMNEMVAISDLSISSSAPTIPNDPAISSPGIATVAKADISGNAPTYTKPTLDSSTNMLTEMEAGTLGTGELDFEQWFNIAGQYIEDEEDTELAQVQLQKIQTYLQAFSQDIQNELNEFNKENEIYKANIQAEILKHQTDAAEAQKEGDLTLQAAIQDYSLELQKYVQELALYQQNINKEVTQYKTNLEQYGLEYSWYQSQQAKLQQDYDKGIQLLVAQGVPQQAQKEGAK